MINGNVAILIALLTSAAFLSAGVMYVRKRTMSVEDYLVARNTAGGKLATATLVASVIGAWVLLSPAETGTWAGLAGLIGYGIGQAAPLVAFIFVGPRMRRLMPEGHSLTEFVWHRYGACMYVFTLAVIVFYMFIFLAAELTGVAQAVSLLADTPLWITASIVGLMTVAYTSYGGIRATIFTDGIQFSLILPLLLVSFGATIVLLGGFGDALAPVKKNAPQLLSLTHSPGVEFGMTLVIAILAANMFHQGFWQRVFTTKDDKALRQGFGVAAAVVVPLILLAGMMGIMAVGNDVVGDRASVALFSLVINILPTWAIVVVLVLALVLVMSSLDTILNGIASVVTSDLARFRPEIRGLTLLRYSRAITVALIVPAIFIASKGYSVLYLFLIADLVCSAAVFPVFWGLYSRRFGGLAALTSSGAGLMIGALFFPKPDFSPWLPDIVWAGKFLASFGMALGISALLSVVLTAVSYRLSTRPYDFAELRERVRIIEG